MKLTCLCIESDSTHKISKYAASSDSTERATHLYLKDVYEIDRALFFSSSFTDINSSSEDK